MHRSLLALILSTLGTVCILHAPAAEQEDWSWDGKESIEAYAKRTGLKARESLDLGGGVVLELVLVPPSSFEIGLVEGKNPEKPVRVITLTRPYYVGKYPVTTAQFRRFVAASQYRTEAEQVGKATAFKNGRFQPEAANVSWKNPGFAQGDNHPVVLVTWNDAQAFAKWASTQSGRTVRLPRDTEFAYAARGRAGSLYPWGAQWKGSKANYQDDCYRSGRSQPKSKPTASNDCFTSTSPVGFYANASWCGAYDLVGNVWEWCEDRNNTGYYATCPDTDPPPPEKGNGRTTRGGAFSLSKELMTTGIRTGFPPATRFPNIGFRVVVTAEKK
jgi:formylglycine-generating enzyme required for sulfatase activity